MDITHRLLDELSRYGLTTVQARVYYVLLQLGETSSTNISRELSVHRSEVYRVLRELEKKGVVIERSGRPTLFRPLPPEECLNLLLRERLNDVQRLKSGMPELIDWLNRQSKVKGTKPSVLVIDDDEGVRKALSRALKGGGFEVETARNGALALEKSRLRLFNVALVDIRLPDIEGTKLLRRLREDNPDVIEIIITGYASTQNAVEAVNEGADGYVVKPFSPRDLLVMMNKKLRGEASKEY